jgi:predicted permease
LRFDILTGSLQQAWRRLARRPIVFVLMIASLGIGVGVNVTLYVIGERFFFESWLTAGEPERLLTIKPGLSYPDYLDLASASARVDYTIFQSATLLWAHDTSTHTIGAQVVSDNYFEVLGVRLLAGRTFRAEAGNPDQVVVSYRFWQQQLAASTTAIGQTLTLNGWPMTIVGVLPKTFYSAVAPMLAPAIYVPASPHVNLGLDDRGAAQFDVLARLRPDATVAQARAEFRSLDRRFPTGQTGEPRSMSLAATAGVLNPIRAPGNRGPTLLVRSLVLGVFAIGALVLLIACANVAGVLAARADERRRDLAIRTAFGATRRRLVLDLLAEGVILGVASVTGAAVLWQLGMALLPRLPALATASVVFMPVSMPIVFPAALAVMIAVICAVVPAMLVSQVNPVEGLRPARASGLRTRLRAPRLLIGVQVTVCSLFLIAVIVVMRTTLSLAAIDPGFDDTHAIVVSTRLPSTMGGEAAIDVENTLGGIAGVDSVSYGALPSALTDGRNRLRLDESEGREVRVEAVPVEAGFLRTLGIRIERGRDLARSDASPEASLIPVVVDRRFADQYLEGREPIGMRMTLAGDAESGRAEQRLVVVGLSRSANLAGRTSQPPAVVFVPSRTPARAVTFVVRASGPARAMVPAVIRTMNDRFPGASASVTTMRERFDGTLAPLRIAIVILGVVAAMGIIVAMIGLHGLVSYEASRRTFEIGVRLALGAERRSLIGLVLRDAAGMVAGGFVLGGLLAAAVGRVAPGIAAGVRLISPEDLALTGGLLAVATIIACLSPIRLALRVESAAALRAD